MEIRFRCSNCGTKYVAKVEQRGNVGKCKNCGTQIIAAESQNVESVHENFDSILDSIINEEQETANDRVQDSLTQVSQSTVWLAWYFRRGLVNIITIPLFFLLSAALAMAVFAALIQGYAFMRVLKTIYGFTGLLGFFFVGWFPVIVPPTLYYSVLKNIPGLWLRPDATRKARIIITVAILVAFPLISHFVHQGTAFCIGWVADRDPCAAFEAGVTGSKPPVDCD